MGESCSEMTLPASGAGIVLSDCFEYKVSDGIFWSLTFLFGGIYGRHV